MIITINFQETKENWKTCRSYVGITPSRCFNGGFGRENNSQPPGLTTELPHHWSVDLDDGTGGGEDSPMQTTEIKGGLFLRPMRIMQQSEIVNVKSGKQLFHPLKETTNHFSLLIRIHWEMVVIIEREICLNCFGSATKSKASIINLCY